MVVDQADTAVDCLGRQTRIFVFMVTECLGEQHIKDDRYHSCDQELYKFATVDCLVALILTAL